MLCTSHTGTVGRGGTVLPFSVDVCPPQSEDKCVWLKEDSALPLGVCTRGYRDLFCSRQSSVKFYLPTSAVPLKMSPDHANDTVNESIKLFSWCFSGVKCQRVSWSLKRFSPWARAGSHARSDGGGDAACSVGAGVAAGENPFPE